MNENQYPVYNLVQALDRLSPRARAKYDALEGLVGDAEALQRALMERIRAREDRLAQLAHERDHSSDPSESARLDAELQRVRADLDKLERERAKRNGIRNNTTQIVSRIDNFLGELFSGAVDIAPPQWPSPVPGARDRQSLRDAIWRWRSQAGIARHELTRIQAAPAPGR